MAEISLARRTIYLNNYKYLNKNSRHSSKLVEQYVLQAIVHSVMPWYKSPHEFANLPTTASR